MHMFRPKNRKRKRQAERSARHNPSRRLFLESLETRRLLAGVVNVITAASPGDLTLDGDNSNNQVEVRAGAVTGQLVITGKTGTLLTLDGGPQSFSSLTVNGIVDDLFVDLGGGNDTFELGTAAGSRTEIADDVLISNDDDDENFIRNADIGGDLTVDRIVDGASSELTIKDTIVRGNTTVDNDGIGGLFDGDSKTVIEKSELEGTLTISNVAGDDTTIIVDTSVGAALFVRPPSVTTDPVIDISNGGGSSFTSITSKNDPATTTPLPPGTLNRPTVYGSINISNGDPVPPTIVVPPPTGGGALPTGLITTVDIVVVNSADVLGELNVDNFEGHSEVIVVDSKIGTDTKPATAPGGYGGPITVANGNGFDVFELNRSEAQYGVFVTNNSGAGQTWGSQSLVADSKVGKRVASGPAFSFVGDDGDDVFNINDSATGTTRIYAAGLSLSLLDGDDEVSIVGGGGNKIEIDSLMVTGGDGDDAVVLQNALVESMLMIDLGAGVDRLELRVLANELPNALIGSILLDGGVGADFFTIPVGIPFTNFETPIS